MRRTIARLLGARRLRRRAPRRLRRCSSTPATARYVPFVPAGRRYPERSGDTADDPVCLAHSLLDFGRVASRPGYPAEPAARSRPFGRVSLTPPLASLTPRSAWPGGSLRSPPPAFPPRSRQATASGFSRSHVRRSPSPRLPLPAAPALGCASARRRSQSRTTPCARRAAARPLTRRGGCPPVPIPGTVFPDVRYPGSGPFHALRRLGSHTPRSTLPGPSPPTVRLRSTGRSTYRSSTSEYQRIAPLPCREKFSHFDGAVQSK